MPEETAELTAYQRWVLFLLTYIAGVLTIIS